jgi:hypothetical protein
MVRTIQSTRTNTNYIPPPRQVPVYPVVVKEIHVDLPRIRVENGGILDDSSEEFLPMPTPVDSGDDDEDEEEEEEEENINEEANDEQQDHYVGLWPVTEHYTSMFETGHFPNLLQDVLHALGTYVRPLYETRRVCEPPRACYYITRIHVRVMDAGDRGFRTLSAHESLTPLSTYAASVSDAARRILWSLNHTYRHQLHNTKYMHLPLRLCGESQTSIVPGGAEEDRLNTLVGVVAGLNTDLDSATLDISRVHLELEDAHARITALEAQLEGMNPPEVQVPAMATSPPRKRIRYGEPGSITRLL